jgi:ribosome-associated protein
MEDSLSETEALGELLRDHRAADVVVMDLRPMSAWTDFFVVATAASDAHMDGLERHLVDFCRERGIEILRRSHRPKGASVSGEGESWRIVDLGHTLVHLMSGKARAFYDLERLYSAWVGNRGPTVTA